MPQNVGSRLLENSEKGYDALIPYRRVVFDEQYPHSGSRHNGSSVVNRVARNVRQGDEQCIPVEPESQEGGGKLKRMRTRNGNFLDRKITCYKTRF